MLEIGQAKRRTGLIIVAGLLLVQILAVAAFFVKDRSSLPPVDDGQSPRLTPGTLWQINHAKPTVRPPTIKGNEATAWLREPIIGVEAGGKARAYRVGAFDDDSGHVVNDLIRGVPVSVAHCNVDGTVSVYVDALGTAPLELEVAGLLNRQMVIKHGGVLYYHTTGAPIELDRNPPPLPYGRLKPVMTTWENWLRLHPESDLFVGDPRTFPNDGTRRPDFVNDPARKMRAWQLGP